MNPRDQELFDGRPKITKPCPHCSGHGRVTVGYALIHFERASMPEPLDRIPPDAICALVVGSSGIYECCKEAVEIAARAQRPVAFEFCSQIVIARAGDDPVRLAREWWMIEYKETPEASAARR